MLFLFHMEVLLISMKQKKSKLFEYKETHLNIQSSFFAVQQEGSAVLLNDGGHPFAMRLAPAWISCTAITDPGEQVAR